MSASSADADRLLELVAGHRVTAVMYTAVEIGIIEVLHDRTSTASEVAESCSADAQSVARLLLALAAIGIVTRNDGAYRLTPLALPLVRSAPGSLRDWVVFEGEMLTRSWQGLADSVRTGKTASELEAGEGGDRFARIGRDPRLAALFDNAMVSTTRHGASDILAAYDFGNSRTVLDVGGGTGALLLEILRAYPAITGAVFDLARCEAGFRNAAAASDLTQRAQFIAGDFRRYLPQGFACHLLKSVLHNWSDSHCLEILGHCREALAPHGRIVVVERLLPEHPAGTARDLSIVLSDLNMLRGPGGRERTEQAYRRLLEQAGFTAAPAIAAGRYDILVAESASR